MRGTIKRWDVVRGFGYIETEEEGPDLWAHASNIVGPPGSKELSPGDVVEFEPDYEAPKGPRAFKVQLVERADLANREG